jgi:hypothetical protein
VLLPVLVIVAAHSRFITARMIPARKTEDLLLGSWELISSFPDPPTCTSATRRSGGYPLPLPGYPIRVFVHQGILHRNSGTKSRAIAAAVVATLKRRD